MVQMRFFGTRKGDIVFTICSTVNFRINESEPSDFITSPLLHTNLSKNKFTWRITSKLNTDYDYSRGICRRTNIMFPALKQTLRGHKLKDYREVGGNSCDTMNNNTGH